MDQEWVHLLCAGPQPGTGDGFNQCLDCLPWRAALRLPCCYIKQLWSSQKSPRHLTCLPTRNLSLWSQVEMVLLCVISHLRRDTSITFVCRAPTLLVGFTPKVITCGSLIFIPALPLLQNLSAQKHWSETFVTSHSVKKWSVAHIPYFILLPPWAAWAPYIPPMISSSILKITP